MEKAKLRPFITDSGYFRVSEVGHLLAVGYQTVRFWMLSGIIRSEVSRNGREKLIPRSEVVRLISEGRIRRSDEQLAG